MLESIWGKRDNENSAIIAEEVHSLVAKHDWEYIFANSYDSVIVTDRDGYILMANPATARLLNISLSEVVGANVLDLISQGIYNKSIALEATEKRCVVTGLIRTGAGQELMTTSMPLLDETGNVTIVITNVRDKSLVDEFLAVLEKERAAAERYKNEVAYFRDRDAG